MTNEQAKKLVHENTTISGYSHSHGGWLDHDITEKEILGVCRKVLSKVKKR